MHYCVRFGVDYRLILKKTENTTIAVAEDQARRNLDEFIQESMKAHTIIAAIVVAITLMSSALGDKYSDLAAKGYRWAIADGLYAWVSKDDVRLIVNNPTSPAGDEAMLKMIEQVKALFLIPGTIVLVTEEDPSSGLSRIRMAGITVDVWTLTKFLSKHAVRDTYGVIETPETSGLIPTTTSAIDAGPTPVPEFSSLPTPGASPTPTPETNQ